MPNVVDFSGRGTEGRILAALVAISKNTRTLLGLRLAEIGLKSGEDDLVVELDDGRTRSVSDLSNKFRVTLPTMAQSVEQLERRGFVERVAGPLVRLSEKGKALLPLIANLRKRLARDIRVVLGAERLERIADDLEDLDSGLRKIVHPIG